MSRLVRTVPLALALAGCDDDASATSDDGAQESSTGSASICDDIEADEYLPGMSKAGTAMTVVLVQSLPAPPTQGDNVWTIDLLDMGQMPMAGAGVTVTTWMPEHGHGSPQDPGEVEEGGGRYRVENLNLHMSGLWEITIAVTLPVGGTTDEVVFRFCVE
jgi:hypothetical protein